MQLLNVTKYLRQHPHMLPKAMQWQVLEIEFQVQDKHYYDSWQIQRQRMTLFDNVDILPKHSLMY